MALIPEIPTTLNNEAKVREKTKLKAHQTAELTASPTSTAFCGINSTATQKFKNPEKM
jgi:hypothetical protein